MFFNVSKPRKIWFVSFCNRFKCVRGFGEFEFEFGARLWEIRFAPSLFVHVWRCSRVFNLINFVKFKANTKRSALCQKTPSFQLPLLQLRFIYL